MKLIIDKYQRLSTSQSVLLPNCGLLHSNQHIDVRDQPLTGLDFTCENLKVNLSLRLHHLLEVSCQEGHAYQFVVQFPDTTLFWTPQINVCTHVRQVIHSSCLSTDHKGSDVFRGCEIANCKGLTIAVTVICQCRLWLEKTLSCELRCHRFIWVKFLAQAAAITPTKLYNRCNGKWQLRNSVQSCWMVGAQNITMLGMATKRQRQQLVEKITEDKTFWFMGRDL